MSTPKPLSRLTEVEDTAEHIASFLTTQDLGRLCTSSKDTLLLFSTQLAEKALLKAVFDAGPKRVMEILKKPRPPRSKCIILARTHIKETYPSEREVGKFFFIFPKKAWKLVCKRDWKNISPLEAAAWCGDIFLVKELLLHVPRNSRAEAYRQLRGMLERKDSEEHGGYLAPFRALIKAYENYNGQFDTLRATCQWVEIDRLWNEVCQKQRLLSTYGIQEYCDDNHPFAPDATFSQEPERPFYLFRPSYGLVLYWEDGPVPYDLDDMRGWALYKSGGKQRNVNWGAGRIIDDPVAITRLCEVRTTGLKNIIMQLEEQLPAEEMDLIQEDEEAIKKISISC